MEIIIIILLAILIIVIYCGIGMAIALYMARQGKEEPTILEFVGSAYFWILLPLGLLWIKKGEKKKEQINANQNNE